MSFLLLGAVAHVGVVDDEEAVELLHVEGVEQHEDEGTVEHDQDGGLDKVRVSSPTFLFALKTLPVQLNRFVT